MDARKTAPANLSGYEDRYHWLTASLPVAVFMISSGPPYTLLSANTVFLQMLGYHTEQELLGRSVLELLTSSTEWEAFARALEQDSMTRTSEMRLMHKAGTDVWAIIGIRAVRDYDNRIIGIEGYARDTTESHVYEMEMQYHETELGHYALALDRANRKLNLLASITRHDIMNQLTALMMTTQLIKDDCNDDKLREYIRMQEEITKKIEQQIGFTKDYHEIGVNSPIWYNVRKGVEAAAASLPLTPGMLTIDSSAAAVIYADPLIEKVFYNLMENALRHGGEQIRITFSSHMDNGNLVLVCEDNGPGVPAKHKEDIFRRMHFKHTGFGLFLSREILGITGLSIRETGEPGKGARFEITVPKDSYESGSSVG
jgi:PAS domain S-box-containing protein